MKSKNPPWTPFEVAEAVPELGDDAIVVNSRYQVNIRMMGIHELFGRIVHLSIKRRDKQPIRNWLDIQRIKNEIAGPECEGVELFPAESRLVDSANQYHLYVFESYRLPFGFADRYVSDSPFSGAVQEPFEWRPVDCGSRDQEAQALALSIHTKIALRNSVARNGGQKSS